MSYQPFSQRTPGNTGAQGAQNQAQSRIPASNTTSNISNVNTANLGNYENQAIQDAILQWSSVGDGRGDIVIHGESDFALLRNLKNILLALQTEFTEGGAKVTFSG